MRKEPDYNDLVLKWPAPFRDGLRFTNHDLALLDIIIYGPTDIAARDFEEMKKFGYIFDGICTIQDEDDDDLPFIMTLVAFRDYQAPPLENGGKSDKKVLKKMKPRRTETGLAPQGPVRSGSAVSSDHGQGDDISQ